MSIRVQTTRTNQLKGGVMAGAAGATAVVIAMTIPFVRDHEGLRTSAYRDPVGIPTICYGETLGVRMGDTATVTQCEEMLKRRLEGFLAAMRACTDDPLPAKTEAAFLSFTYNLGEGTYCRNIADRRLDEGLYWEACAALSLYTKAGGRELPGLVRRRAEERALCEEGLREAGIPRT